MYYIGIDLGGTNIAVGIVDENCRIVKKGSVPTLAQREPEAIIKDMADLCAKLIEEAGLTLDDIAYAGIAAPGTANCDTGTIEYANNLPFRNFKIAEILQGFIPFKKVYVENDANAAALGEAVAGAAKGTRYAIMITLGTGLGGGIIIDHKVYSGFNHAGGELGHMVIEVDGRPCTCGRKGCWEAYSSATALISMTKEKLIANPDKTSTIMWDMVEGDVEKVSGKTAFAAMKKGDKLGAEVVDTYIKYLASGITSIINLFQPEILCIGGGICNEGDYLIKPLVAQVNEEQYTRSALMKTELKVAALGNDAGIIGAAVLGL